MSRSAKDFAMICANCHRMIHRMMRKDKDRVISLDEFKKRISSKFKEGIKEL
jgi:predicted HNH restriction endonuclease